MNPEHDEKNDKNLITMGLAELHKLIAKNSALAKENEMLKESSPQFQTLEQQTQKGFAMIQVQLEKVLELLQNKPCNYETVTSNLFNEEEMIAQKNIQFPLQSKDELDILENQLDMDFEKALVKHFSKVCGTSGKLKIGKIGLQLVRHMFTDELLNQLTWKGIKGCTKVPFSAYIKIRNLFFQIMNLADNSCSAKDADALLQNSAIKHSGQRIKRKSCEMKKTMPEKQQIEVKEKQGNDSDASCRTELEVGVIVERHTGPEDPLADINCGRQCRICTKITNNCINATDKPYLKNNKISLTLNDVDVELNFNDTQKVCLDCDKKLLEMVSFVKLVKNAQDALLNVSYDMKATETIFVKTESESPTDDNDEIDEDTKEGIVDSITIDETFVKDVSTHKKRKCDKDTKRTTKRQKKPKVEDIKVSRESTELIMNIKDEPIERDDDANTSNIYKSAESEDRDTWLDVKPELDMTNALLNKMADDGFS